VLFIKGILDCLAGNGYLKTLDHFIYIYYVGVFRMDKLHMALTELCFAINHSNVIYVWEHGFVPREFFHQTLESRFNK